MSPSPIAAQLYTVRQYIQNPADFAQSMRKIREIGYKAVQLSGIGPIDPRDQKKVLDNEGLTACATHVSLDRLQHELDAVIEEHHLYECRHCALGGLPDSYRNTDGYHRFAQKASDIAQRLADAGITFSYHNHNFEFQIYGDKTGLEILFTESNPDLFNMEIDTYWVQSGGGSPVHWIEKCTGRIPLLHLKDMTIIDSKQTMAEVGEGNLDWPAILDAAKRSGVEWYLVEQDECKRDPFESLEISFRNLKAMGL